MPVPCARIYACIYHVPYRKIPWVTYRKLMEFHGKNMKSVEYQWVIQRHST